MGTEQQRVPRNGSRSWLGFLKMYSAPRLSMLSCFHGRNSFRRAEFSVGFLTVQRHDMRNPTPKCSEAGCDRRAHARGVCEMHYASHLRSGTLPPKRGEEVPIVLQRWEYE